MDIEIHHSFAESTHVGKGIIHWFLTWFLWEDIQKSQMSGPCRTCCSVVLLGRSTKGSGIRLSRRFAGLTAGLSTYHVGACQTCESQKSRFEGLKIRDRYSDFFLCCFFRNYCSHWKRLGTGMPKWLWQKMAPVPAVKQNPFGIEMGFTPPDFLITCHWNSISTSCNTPCSQMLSSCPARICLQRKCLSPTVASTCGLAAGSSCDVDFLCGK